MVVEYDQAIHAELLLVGHDEAAILRQEIAAAEEHDPDPALRQRFMQFGMWLDQYLESKDRVTRETIVGDDCKLVRQALTSVIAHCRGDVNNKARLLQDALDTGGEVELPTDLIAA